jgi:Type I phosphodiesterase / nucleotide pyrophosphatase
MKKQVLSAVSAVSVMSAAVGLAAAMPASVSAATSASTLASAPVKHVLLISVDGLHGSDLANYVHAHPDSTLAALAKAGIDYSDAHTVAPADSFPGLLALVTGGTPAVTGVYYDDTYDRKLSPPGSDCHETGAHVRFNEDVDKPGADGHPMIDPAKLPRDPRQSCAPVYPHAYLRVNTVFEVVRNARGYTAWVDKHPTYELVEGPSGHGVNDLFLPEIGGDYEGISGAPVQRVTGSLATTEAYDDMKAQAVINEIDGRTHDGLKRAPVPTVFGLNLQTVNVAQKLNGYRDAQADLTTGVDSGIGHVDAILARFMRELDRRDLREQTLVIVTAKHGNGPVDPALLHKIDSHRLAGAIEQAAPGALAQLTGDHGALVWLRDPSAVPAVAEALRKNADALGIAQVLSGVALARRFPSPAADSRTPDIVVISRDGVIYTKPSDGKLAEHGGFHDDDTGVALLISNPRLALAGQRLTSPVSTTQVAPTILAALGLPPDRLQAVAKEGTTALPGIGWRARTSPAQH